MKLKVVAGSDAIDSDQQYTPWARLKNAWKEYTTRISELTRGKSLGVVNVQHDSQKGAVGIISKISFDEANHQVLADLEISDPDTEQRIRDARITGTSIEGSFAEGKPGEKGAYVPLISRLSLVDLGSNPSTAILAFKSAEFSLCKTYKFLKRVSARKTRSNRNLALTTAWAPDELDSTSTVVSSNHNPITQNVKFFQLHANHALRKGAGEVDAITLACLAGARMRAEGTSPNLPTFVMSSPSAQSSTMPKLHAVDEQPDNVYSPAYQGSQRPNKNVGISKQ